MTVESGENKFTPALSMVIRKLIMITATRITVLDKTMPSTKSQVDFVNLPIQTQ